MNATQTAVRQTNAPRFYTVEGIKRDAQYNFSGHFFGKGIMKFFNSRIGGEAYQSVANPHKTLFVTSERFDDNTPRLYTVREYNSLTGQVETVGEFQQYKTGAQAHKAAKKIALGE